MALRHMNVNGALSVFGFLFFEMKNERRMCGETLLTTYYILQLLAFRKLFDNATKYVQSMNAITKLNYEAD